MQGVIFIKKHNLYECYVTSYYAMINSPFLGLCTLYQTISKILLITYKCIRGFTWTQHFVFASPLKRLKIFLPLVTIA